MDHTTTNPSSLRLGNGGSWPSVSARRTPISLSAGFAPVQEFMGENLAKVRFGGINGRPRPCGVCSHWFAEGCRKVGMKRQTFSTSGSARPCNQALCPAPAVLNSCRPPPLQARQRVSNSHNSGQHWIIVTKLVLAVPVTDQYIHRFSNLTESTVLAGARGVVLRQRTMRDIQAVKYFSDHCTGSGLVGRCAGGKTQNNPRQRRAGQPLHANRHGGPRV